MADIVIGTITQWSDLRPSKYHNFNKGVQIDDVWYNFYSKDANYLNNIQMSFPAGTKVKIEYDETKGYKPISKMDKALDTEQATLKAVPVKPVPVVSQRSTNDGVLRSVSLYAAVETYKGRQFLNDLDQKDVAGVITRLADQYMEWLRHEVLG